MVETLRYLEVTSAYCLLGIHDLFTFFHHDSPDLLPIKNKVGITLANGSFVVKEGLLFQANFFIQKLQAFQKKNLTMSNGLTISSALLDRHPVLRLIISFFENSSQSNDSSVKFKYTVVETTIANHDRTKTRYCYNDSIRDLASCLFILGGRNVYEFIRLNIPGLFPSLPVIEASLDSTANRFVEGEFRYNLMFDHLPLQKTNFIFAYEDGTAVIPRITYDVQSNTFIDFAPHLKDGLPLINSFATDSFAELENWIYTSNKSYLLNLHMIQPITLNLDSSSPFVLFACGIDNHFTTLDILMRWMSIVNQCDKIGVKVVGYSTDCDTRYLRAMRLFIGFFADMPNQQFHLHGNAFYVDIPRVISLI